MWLYPLTRIDTKCALSIQSPTTIWRCVASPNEIRYLMWRHSSKLLALVHTRTLPSYILPQWILIERRHYLNVLQFCRTQIKSAEIISWPSFYVWSVDVASVSCLMIVRVDHLPKYIYIIKVPTSRFISTLTSVIFHIILISASSRSTYTHSKL